MLGKDLLDESEREEIVREIKLQFNVVEDLRDQLAKAEVELRDKIVELYPFNRAEIVSFCKAYKLIGLERDLEQDEVKLIGTDLTGKNISTYLSKPLTEVIFERKSELTNIAPNELLDEISNSDQFIASQREKPCYGCESFITDDNGDFNPDDCDCSTYKLWKILHPDTFR